VSMKNYSKKKEGYPPFTYIRKSKTPSDQMSINGQGSKSRFVISLCTCHVSTGTGGIEGVIHNVIPT